MARPVPNRAVGLRDRAIAVLARLLTGAYFRSVEREGPRLPDGPVILAASHLYGFVDPVVLVAKLGFLPRFLAKATLWKTPMAPLLLRIGRVLPVHRRVDGATTADNLGTFDHAVQALARGEVVAVFPEGTTHDDPTIRPLRTGAARIALQAANQGVAGVKIVPVGVTYEDKVAVRGRALVSFGPPIAVAGPSGPAATDEPDRDRVRAITDALQGALEDLTPSFESTEEALALGAASTMLHLPAGGRLDDVPLSRVAATSRRLADAPAGPRRDLVGLVARYRMLLGFVDLDDEHIARGIDLGALARRIALLAVLVVVLSPFAAAGFLANLVPALIVLGVGLVPSAPVSKGTVRLLAAVVAFPATWVGLALLDGRPGTTGDVARAVTTPLDPLVGAEASSRGGWAAAVVVIVAVPLLGAAALALVERTGRLVVTIVRWRTLLDRRGQLDEVRRRRAEVVTHTRRLLGP